MKNNFFKYLFTAFTALFLFSCKTISATPAGPGPGDTCRIASCYGFQNLDNYQIYWAIRQLSLGGSGGSDTGAWKLVGNTTGAVRKLGTLDPYGVSLITNGNERLNLTSNGRLIHKVSSYDQNSILSWAPTLRTLHDWAATEVFNYSGNSTDSFRVIGLGATYYKPGTIFRNRFLQVDTFMNVGRVDSVASYINLNISHTGYDAITFRNSHLGNYHAWQEEGGIGLFLTGYNSTAIDAPYYIGAGVSGYSKSISFMDNARLIDFNNHTGTIKTGTGPLVLDGLCFASPYNSDLLLRADISNGVSGKGVTMQGYNGGAWVDLIKAQNGATPLIIMANLPTSVTGLPTGALWNNAGILSVAP